MTHYLIEIRLHGIAKRFTRNLIWDIAKRFRVKGAIKSRPVPHITLAGPFTTNNVGEILKQIEIIGKQFGPVSFCINGFDSFRSIRDGRVVLTLKIEPSYELKELRWELSKRLQRYIFLKEQDFEMNFKFHATIAFKDIDRKFNKIIRYIQEITPFEINTNSLRICLLKNKKILYEYDLMSQRFLSRRQALYRNYLKYELTELAEQPIKINLDNKNISKVFLVGDLHLNHSKIIKYCYRPFKSVRQMNRILVNNWNKTINKNDIVFFLGDLVLGRKRNKIQHWLKKLNGNIYFIRGNHDRGNLKNILYFNKCIIHFKGREFCLIHDPKKEINWNDWIIHSHTHNNNIQMYPFINKRNKTVNVGVELTDYKPISLAYIIDSINRT